ncbi:unnamed protein product, partial [Brassica rapa subsp. narinosa]
IEWSCTHVQFSSNSNAELNDLLSITSEFNLTKYSAKWRQLSPLISHFQRLHGYSLTGFGGGWVRLGYAWETSPTRLRRTRDDMTQRGTGLVRISFYTCRVFNHNSNSM